MSQPAELRRRFAPVPIETTFESVRRPAQQTCLGPRPEPTQDPSPRSASPTIPEPPPSRRFHPQLIETSRRTCRAGDPGPATRLTDKTDITPSTNHIYLTRHRHRRKRGDEAPNHDEPVRHMPPSRRETEDEGVQEYLLDLAAKETARQIQEAALAAFPNSRAREGGVAHFYFRESSGSDNSADDAHRPRDGAQPRVRRKSSNLGLNWWHQYMQEHAKRLARDRAGRDHDIPSATNFDVDDMDLCLLPNPLWTTTQRVSPGERRDSPVAVRPTDILVPDGPWAPAPHLAPSEGRRARPFGVIGFKSEDAQLHLMRQAASPPMLGKDLTFRRCPSPKQTKLETDHPFVDQRERSRDVPGQGGLWKGHCCRSGSNGGNVVSAGQRHAGLVVTPPTPALPREPLTCDRLSEEPSPPASSGGPHNKACGMWAAGPRPRRGEARAQGLLQPLGVPDERRERERARDKKILQEFDDEFVTQVYNYLSLGYPATARPFDQELSRVSRISTAELGRDDRRMAKGHMLEMRLDDTPEDARCPRWRALKVYILQWARSHPNLDDLDPLTWGVRERRGS